MSLISRIENAVKEYARRQAELSQIGQKALDKYCGKEGHPDCSSLNYISELAQAVQTENPEDTHDAAFMLSNARDDVFILNCYRYNDPVGKQCIDSGKNAMSCDLGKIVTDTFTEGADLIFGCGVESKSSYVEDTGINMDIDWQKYACCVNGFVDFADSNLEKGILEGLVKKEGKKITCGEASQIFNLDPDSGYSISSLSGIECFINLKELNLFNDANPVSISDITPLEGLANLTLLVLTNNQVSDITPLAGLTNLVTLRLGNNHQISDITPLAGLTNLTELDLDWNQISDITPLAELTNLTGLNLRKNQISDITPLAGLTNLKGLYLSLNQISDISPLVGFTNLTSLDLHDNKISDITPLTELTNLTWLILENNQIIDILPLVQNTGLGAGDFVGLIGNYHLSEKSINEYIPALEARGVNVGY